MNELLGSSVEGRHHPITERNPSISSLVERVGQQTEKMQNWRENGGPYETSIYLRDEADELVKAIEDDEEAFEVASEIGDVVYLAFKICYDLGINPADAVQMKILRNDLKYSTDMNSHGEYQTSRQVSKAFWGQLGGDVAFSHAYLGVIGQLLDETEEPVVYETKEEDIKNEQHYIDAWNKTHQGNDYY